MTWWQEHLILNIIVFMMSWSFTDGDTKEALRMYLLVVAVFYGFMGMFYLIISKGGHIPI